MIDLYQITAAIIIVATIYLIYYCWKYSLYNVSRVKSTVDGEYYYISRAHPNRQEAADFMADIAQTIHKMIKHLKENIHENHPYYEKTQFLLSNYNPDVLIESSPHNIRKYTSYLENKGQRFAICLRKRNKRTNFEERNLTIFVILHEISHAFSLDYGHNKEFWRNFRFMLQEAVKIGIYQPVDYSKQNSLYCGLLLSSNPMYATDLD